ELGAEKSYHVLIQLLKYPDYDITTLSASFLHNADFRGLHSDKLLNDVLADSQGSAIRLAIACVLYSDGQVEPLKEMVVPNLISSIDDVKKHLSEEEKSRKVQEIIALDWGFKRKHEAIEEIRRNPMAKFMSRIERAIFWDVATEGRGPTK